MTNSFQKGFVLPVVIISILVLTITGMIFITTTGNRRIDVQRKIVKNQSFWLAEAGLERAMAMLREDFANNPSNPSWADSDINGQPVDPPDNDNFYTLLSTTIFSNGTYSVSLRNISDGAGGSLSDEIWVKATGTVGTKIREIQARVKAENLSIWNNIIVAGNASAGTLINGNVIFAGSLLIFGGGLGPSDSAIDLSGTVGIYNYYKDMDPIMEARLPDLPTIIFNGETVKTLNAVLRVENGIVELGGDVTIGESDVFGNDVKETLDGTYVTDGFNIGGSAEVNSDNGDTNPYDLGNEVSFPILNAGFITDFKSNALVIDAGNPIWLNQMTDIKPNDNFSYADANGSISMDGSGNLTISGNIYVDGQLNFNPEGGDKTIIYVGKGVILAEGDASITTSLITDGDESFPTNVLGIMTTGDMVIGQSSQIDIMGVFYASDTITIDKQTDIVGSIGADQMDMGSNVPAIYQVPDLFNNLPDGMIASAPDWRVLLGNWQEIY